VKFKKVVQIFIFCREFFMQKNVFSYVLGVAALSFLCSCGTGKKDEVKVDVKEQAPIEQKADASKEVAQAEQQTQAEQAVATTESKEATAVAQAMPGTEAPVESKETKAAEENKVA
jgi:hypothetical protein